MTRKAPTLRDVWVLLRVELCDTLLRMAWRLFPARDAPELHAALCRSLIAYFKEVARDGAPR